jgi:hypothetical protein
VVAACISSAFAQAGPALLLKPWQESDRFELRSDFMFQDEGRVKEWSAVLPEDFDAQLFQYEAAGRYRPFPEDRRQLSLGFDMAVLDFDADFSVFELDSLLADQSVSAGVGIGEHEDWEFAVIAGVGYSHYHEEAFGDEDEFYPRADFIATRRLDEKSRLTLVLDYNRNRAIFPDLPLPAVSYTRRHSDQLTFIVGLPISAVTWTPIEKLTIDVTYAVPLTFDAAVGYDVMKDVAVFAQFENRFYSFMLDWNDDRIFFEQRRVEAGVRWQAVRQLQLELAAGYAFDQEFFFGWDVRDLDDGSELSDEPYVRFALRAAF